MKKKDTLLHYVQRIKKADLIDHASNLHIALPASSMCVKEMRQLYSTAILDHPLDIMAQLPYSDLKLIDNLKDEELSSRNIPSMFNYCCNLIFYYGMCDDYWDEDGGYWITVPEDFAQAMLPHVDEILNNKDQQLRLGIESIVEGMANLYGIVRLDELKQVIKRSFAMTDDDDVNKLWNTIREYSLLLKWMEWSPNGKVDDITRRPDTEVYFLSRYSWIAPQDMLNEISERSHLVQSNKEYTDYDMIGAARWPVPEIPNPKKSQFFNYLKKKLGLEEYDCYEAAFNLWFRAVHEVDEYFEFGEYTSFFIKQVLTWSDRNLDMKGMNEAMKQLTEYMNNMPRWALRGHSPAEVTPLKGMKRAPRISLGPNMRRMGYDEQEVQRLVDEEWSKSGTLFPSFSIPNRNDPCPCGSGKKYKNCHGRDN